MALKATIIQFLLSQVRNSVDMLDGGLVYFYEGGTSTAKTVWLDRDKLIAANNPYTLDANGTAQLFGDGIYRVVIKNTAGVVVYDRDGLNFVDYLTSGYYQAVDTDYASLNDAVAQIGAVPTTLTIKTANFPVVDDVSVPDTLTLFFEYPGTLDQGTYNVTINSVFDAPVRQIFMGTGTISFGSQIPQVYPQWFGAVADGVADDTAAVQLALDAGPRVFFMDGVYKVSGLTKNGSTHLVGQSKAGAILATSADTDLLTISDSTGNITVENLTLQARTAMTSGAALNVSNNFQIGALTVRDVIIGTDDQSGGNEFKYGIKWAGGEDTHLSRVIFTGPVAQPSEFIAMYVVAAGPTAPAVTGPIRVTDCAVYAALKGFSVANGSNLGVEGIQIEDTDFTLVGTGLEYINTAAGYYPPQFNMHGGHISSYDTNVKIQANTQSTIHDVLMYNSASIGGFIDATDLDYSSWHHNTFIAIGTGDPFGIKVSASAPAHGASNIDHNIFAMKTGSTQTCIALGTNIIYMNVDHNSMFNGSGNVVTVAAPAATIKVKDNYPLDQDDYYQTVTPNPTGDSAEIDISAARSDFIVINGNTDKIIAIAGRAGQRVTLWNSGYEIIKNTATIKLKGATDFTFDMAGTITLYNAGGTWYEVGRGNA